MKKRYGLLMLILCCGTLYAQTPEEFRNPPMDKRPKPLWFWNNTTVTREGIDAQMTALKEQCGYGGLSILPFGPDFKPKYLSEEYFRLYEHMARKAGELGMTLALYDEYGFPSGSGGWVNADGIPRFLNRFPSLGMKRLDKIEDEATGGTTFHKPVSTEGKIMGIVAMNTETLERIDLSDKVSEGVLAWKVPEGEWKIMQFVCVPDPDQNMDYLSKEAAHAYISMTHEAYYEHFPDLFGSVINETFFDEPTLYRAAARCWTPTFNEEYEARFGSSPVLFYPALWYDIGEDTQAARNALFSFRADLYAEAYPKAISEWSAAHGAKATGHQDNEERENPVGTSADLMKCFKYQEIPGIDKIGGDRPAENFYKVVSSAAYNWDHSLVMSETYGAMGNISWDTIYSIAMDQYAKGINVLIPHAAWYNDKDVTFLPELSHRNPLYADGLHAFNTFLARLNLMLQNEDRTVLDIALLYPIASMQGEHYFDGPLGWYEGGVALAQSDYVQVSRLLSNHLGKDFLFLHPEVLNASCRIEKNRLKLENEKQYNSFHTLIIPSMQTISTDNLQKALELFRSGGRIVFTTQLPSKAAEIGQDARVEQLLEELYPRALRKQGTPNRNDAGGEVWFVEEPSPRTLASALHRTEAFDVEFPEGVTPLRYIHKDRDGRSLYYMANIDRAPYNSVVAIRGKKEFELWNPHTGVRVPADTEYTKKGKDRITLVKLSLDPMRSVFLVEKK